MTMKRIRLFTVLDHLHPRIIGTIVGKALKFAILHLTATKNDVVVFYALQNDYTCNPKAIAEMLIARYPKYELFWILRPDRLLNARNFPEGITVLEYNTFRSYSALASAKLIVNNSLDLLSMPKKESQVLIQTWHGSLGIKRLGGFMPTENGDKLENANRLSRKDYRWFLGVRRRTKKTNYCISNSTFETNTLYRHTYWDEIPILEYGHPRNDILINVDNTIKDSISAKIRKRYGIDDDERILLYAPTFRKDEEKSDCFCIDLQTVLRALRERTGEKWKALCRMHYFTKIADSSLPFGENTIIASDYPDIQELLLAVDAGITDYSSWIFDFMLTRKMAFIFAPDLSDYDAERGFFYPLETTPFPVAYDMDSLINNIEKIDLHEYAKQISSFLDGKGCIEDGKATQRVVDLINAHTGVY
jgi:CDP-glycerol glycerophosphotransferase